MASKHLSDEQIALFAEAMSTNSSEKLSLELRSHVSNCDECAQMVLMVAETIDGIQDTEKIIPINTNAFKRYDKWVVVAASVIIFISVGVYLSSFLNNTSIESKIVEADSVSINKTEVPEAPNQIVNSPKVAEQKQSKPIKKKVKKAPSQSNQMAYAANDQLEKLSSRFLPNASMRGDNIEVLSANTIQGKANVLQLEWLNSSNELLIVEFFDNKGEKLFEIETNASNYKLNKLKQNGLYYWKLINQDFDLLYCGRIKIK